ncbi:polysaccharide biosynthesis/export family protein [Rhodopirellula sp.]|nr:polysaccharide biosynthesis/export family protein [Rhodopirellula sp.]
MHCATRPSDSGSVVPGSRNRRMGLAFKALSACVLAASLSGCAALTQPIEGVPANRLPADFFPEPKNELVPVDISLLSIEPPRDYQLGPGDILGVYVDGILPYSQPNSPPQPPPVNFPGAESSLPPSIGYPIAVQDDGTLSLPLLEPISVEGLTLDQVRDAIRDAYIKEEILRPDKARPIVTIIRERTYNVVVIREDAAQTAGADGGGARDYSASGSTINLPAYKNDILHALVQTGGLPGLGAKNEILILRASKADKRKREEFMRTFYAYREAAQLDPCACLPQLPDDPTVLRIPLRVKPGVVPALDEEDVTLEDGDIVYIESREREVFYTGGLLGGGEFPLPRDYDLDVLGAMAMSGQLYQTGQQGGGMGQRGGGGLGGMGGLQGVPPGIVYILRKTECDGQIAIEVDLKEAYNNPSARPLIQPGDYVILQYKCEEELINYGLQTFFTFGIAELYR